MFGSSAAVLLLLLAVTTTAGAQSDALGAGSRVRVTTGDRQLVGVVRSAGGGSLSLIDARVDSVFLTGSEVRTVEVSRGRKSNGGRGATTGAGAGLFVGILLGSFPAHDQRDSFLGDGLEGLETMGRMGTYGLIGGVAGAVLGFAIGSRSESERWSRVELDRPVAFAAPGRIGLSVSFRAR